MKKIVSLILCAVLFVSVCAVGVSAEMTYFQWENVQEEVGVMFLFGNTVTPDFVIYRLQNHFADFDDPDYWTATEPDVIPEGEFEEMLYRLFDRDYIASLGMLGTLRTALGYDEAAKTYSLPHLAGFGGTLLSYLSGGFKAVDGDKYDVYYPHVTYEFCDKLTEEMAETIGWNDDYTVTYDGYDWEYFMGDFYRIASFDDYGVKVSVSVSGADVTVCGCENFEIEGFPELDPIPEKPCGMAKEQLVGVIADLNRMTDMNGFSEAYVVYTVEEVFMDYDDPDYYEKISEKITVSAEEYETVMYALFAKELIESNGWLEYIRTDSGYDPGDNCYHFLRHGGMGGAGPAAYGYIGHVDNGDGTFTFCYAYRDVIYSDYLDTEKADAIGYNEDYSVTYGGYDWFPYYDTFYRFGEPTDSGLTYTVRFNEHGACLVGAGGFDGLPDFCPGPLTVYGDANCDGTVNAKDVSVMMKHIAGFSPEMDAEAADTNGDGVINAKDVALLLKYIAGWDVVLGAKG